MDLFRVSLQSVSLDLNMGGYQLKYLLVFQVIVYRQITLNNHFPFCRENRSPAIYPQYLCISHSAMDGRLQAKLPEAAKRTLNQLTTNLKNKVLWQS